jgi:photosystem II stability/assembly factor-like uncharacterized protein
MLCREGGAVLFGSRILSEVGSPVSELEAVAIHLDGKGRRADITKLGRGYVVGASRVDQTFYALRGTRRSDGREDTELVRSTDDARTWLAASSPAALVGVAFLNPLVGYVWSEGAVFWTGDGGVSWPHRVAMSATLPRGISKPSRYAVDSDENLWVMVDEAPRRELFRQHLVRVHPDLRQDAFREINGSISAIEAGSDGRVWVTLQKAAGQPTELVEINVDSSNRLSLSKAKEFEPSLLVDYLKVAGSSVIVALAKPRGGPAERFLTVSKDGGRSWKNVRPPPEVSLYCALDADRIWMSDGTQEVYAP